MDIKASKGNTEANSLKQADRINSTGIYEFGLKEVKKGNLVNTFFISNKNGDSKCYIMLLFYLRCLMI